MDPEKDSREPLADDDIPPSPPKLIAELKWILVHGRRHWGLVTLAFFIVVVGWLVSMPSSVLKNITDPLFRVRMIQRTVNDLRLHYPAALEALPRSGPVGFAEVETDIGLILKLDPANGHGLYYSGEVKRVKNRSLFTEKSCVIPERLAESRERLDTYENDFYRYLDIQSALPPSETDGGSPAQVCYDHLSGYCPQRTAWVHHLLANDLFEEAKLSTNPEIKAEKFRHALEHAQMAANLYTDPEGNQGFVNCVPTTVLIREAKNPNK
jgi:hypothetical protein